MMNFYNEIEMLKGCVNRMCVTNDIKELESRREWARKYIDIIFDARQEELAKNDKEE
jgi:hypothetical protein